MIPDDLLALLRCPITRQPLSWAAPDLLDKVNARSGNPAPGESGAFGDEGRVPLDAALVRADGSALYPVLGGIPVLLAERAIPL